MIADDITWYLETVSGSGSKKPATISAYAADLEKLAVFADDTGVADAAEMDETFLSDFLLNLKNTGASQSGIRRMVACLHGFFGALVLAGRLKEDPSENLSGTRDAKGAAKEEDLPALSEREQRALLDATRGEDLLSLRDRALLSLLLSTGLRTSEALPVRIRDLDFLLDCVRAGQEGETRIVPFSEEAERDLRAYIDAWREYLPDRESLLFVNRNGEPFSRQGLWKIVRRAGKRAGISGAVTPGRIRKSVAAGLLARGASREKIAQILGWREETRTSK